MVKAVLIPIVNPFLQKNKMGLYQEASVLSLSDTHPSLAPAPDCCDIRRSILPEIQEMSVEETQLVRTLWSEMLSGNGGCHHARIITCLHSVRATVLAAIAYPENPRFHATVLLHDFGKFDPVIEGPGLHNYARVFTPQEKRFVQIEHTLRGAAGLEERGLGGAYVEVAGGHHEKLDGTGYPHGLTGNHIPQYAFAASLIEVLEVSKVSERTYSYTNGSSAQYDTFYGNGAILLRVNKVGRMLDNPRVLSSLSQVTGNLTQACSEYPEQIDPLQAAANLASVLPRLYQADINPQPALI